MGNDSKKENRWAKVLADAGLLDDVDDAWELPEQIGGKPGGHIQVDPQGESVVSAGDSSGASDDDAQVTVEVASRRSARDDDTARITSASLGGRRDDGDSTVEVVYKNGPNRGDDPSVRRRSDVDSVFGEGSRSTPFGPAKRADTDPGVWARHSMGEWNGGDVESQPRIAVASRKDDERISSSGGASDGPGLEDAVERLQSREDQSTEDPFVEVRGSRISIAPFDSVPPESDMGHIEDRPMTAASSSSGTPVSVDPDPIELDALPPSRDRMVERYDFGDFTGARELALAILETDPGNIDAAQVKRSCEEQLTRMYVSKIGELDRVPAVKVSNHELMWRNLDAQSGFVLSRIDGMSSYEDILDMSGMSRFDALRILEQLLGMDLIE